MSFKVFRKDFPDIFKVIYPILFSFVVLGLYSVFKKQTTNKIAFMSCFLFISVFMFFLEMPYLARQEIGELFVVLMTVNINSFFYPSTFSITLFTGLHLHVHTSIFLSGDFNQEFEFN